MDSTAYEVAALSWVGAVRQHNEDAFLVAHPRTGEVIHSVRPECRFHANPVSGDAAGMVVAIADGTGGTGGGDLASRIVCETVAAALPQLVAGSTARGDIEARLEQVVKSANAAVRSSADAGVGVEGMGSTLVLAWFRDRFVHFVTVGDSRLYLMRNQRLALRTLDQIVPTPSGQERRADDLLQAVGWAEEVEPVCGIAELRTMDLVMLCTDGVTNELDDGALQEILNAPSPALVDTAAAILAAAVQRGGRDNLSVLLVRPTRLPVASRRSVDEVPHGAAPASTRKPDTEWMRMLTSMWGGWRAKPVGGEI